MQSLNLPNKHPYQYINQYFTMDQLRMMCTNLGINIQNLRGETLQSKALELQSAMSRNLQLGDLLIEIPRFHDAKYNPEDYLYLLIENHITSQQITSICQELALPCEELMLRTQDLAAYDHNPRFRKGKAQILHAYVVQENRLNELIAVMQQLAPMMNLKAFTEPLPKPERPAPPEPEPEPQPPEPRPPTGISYENFVLRIGEKRSDGKYPIEVLESPHGQVNPIWQEFPIEAPEFKSLALFLERLIAQGADAKALGQKIYSLLFPSDIAGKYYQCVTSTKQQGKGLRLRLRIDPPELDHFPWEYCFHPQYDYLAHNKMTPFVRYPSEGIEGGSLKMNGPIRVLFVTSNPDGSEEGLDLLNPETEKALVEKALKPLIDKGDVVFNTLDAPASAEALDMKIQDGDYDILHYFGHGIVMEDGQGALALEDEFDNSVQPLDAEQMRAIFRNSGIKVAFLNACHVGGHQGKDPMNSIGRSLVRAGIPAVVAMQFKLPQKTAHLFSRRLYASLAKREPFDQAISTIRRSAFISTRDKTHWGIPILTMRAEDGSF